MSAMRPPPSASPDTQFFWDGVHDHRLLVQRCDGCGTLRHPPRPMCPQCNALEWSAIEASGRGTVHSFVMPQHPPMPWFDDRNGGDVIVVLVDLEEGTRLVSNVVGVAPTDVEIGMPVEVSYEHFDGDVVLPLFRPAAGR
jgi:uncharacterized OB-fold protein